LLRLPLAAEWTCNDNENAGEKLKKLIILKIFIKSIEKGIDKINV
jgi:hypothetical protein